MEEKINALMWGAHYASVLDGKGQEVLLILRTPSLKDRNFINFIYKKSSKEARALGILNEFELRANLKSRGIWSELNDRAIEDLQERLGELREHLEEIRNVRERRTTLNLIATYEETLNKELGLKNSFFDTTVERYASNARNNAAVYCCVFNEHDERYWDTWSDFQSEEDVGFINNIVGAINELDVFDIKEIRAIARAPEWRYMWNAAKSNLLSLFDKPINEFNIDQRNLLYWSQVYDSVYESYERPDDSIINDDERLDKWFDDQERNRKNKAVMEGKQAGGVKVSSAVNRHGEIGIVANPLINPQAPEFTEIVELNPEYIRKFKEKEARAIKERRQINEKDLRARSDRMARKIIGSNAAIIGKGSLGGQARGGRSARKIVPGESIG